MGDRCWAEVTVRKDHAERFLQIADYDPESQSESDHVVEFQFQEVNYGMGRQLDKAAADGLEFYGHHTAGDSYGSSEFFSDGKGSVECIPTGDDGYGIVVSGSTPSERWSRLRELETRIAQRDELIKRMNNPLYDLIKESA